MKYCCAPLCRISSEHTCVRLTRWDDRRAASSIHRAITDLITSGIHAKRYDVLVSLMNFGPIWCPIPHILFQRNALYYSADYRTRSALRLASN